MCTAQEFLATLARPYALVVVNLLAKHERLRFGELEKRVEGASAKALTARLRELERAGVIARSRLGGVPPGVEYSLTSLGRRLRSALAPILSFT